MGQAGFVTMPHVVENECTLFDAVVYCHGYVGVGLTIY